jgi:hypothetical protein
VRVDGRPRVGSGGTFAQPSDGGPPRQHLSADSKIASSRITRRGVPPARDHCGATHRRAGARPRSTCSTMPRRELGGRGVRLRSRPAASTPEPLRDLRRREVVVAGQRARHAGLIHRTHRAACGIGLEMPRENKCAIFSAAAPRAARCGPPSRCVLGRGSRPHVGCRRSAQPRCSTVGSTTRTSSPVDRGPAVSEKLGRESARMSRPGLSIQRS